MAFGLTEQRMAVEDHFPAVSLARSKTAVEPLERRSSIIILLRRRKRLSRVYANYNARLRRLLQAKQSHHVILYEKHRADLHVLFIVKRIIHVKIAVVIKLQLFVADNVVKEIFLIIHIHSSFSEKFLFSFRNPFQARPATSPV